MNIKRAKYNSQVGEIFEIKVIDKNIVLFENENPFNGKLELEYENGELHSEGIIEKGLKEGEWNTYYRDGFLKIKEMFSKGKRIDKYYEYYPNGNIKLEIDYKADRQNGNYIEYYETGEKKVTGRNFNNEKVGEWEKFRKNGSLIDKVRFVNDKAVGKSYSYNEDGSLKGFCNYVDGEKNGIVEVYYENEKLFIRGEYKNDLENGVWREYWENGELFKKYFMENGKKERTEKKYYTSDTMLNGFKAVRKIGEEAPVWYEVTMKANKRNGKYTEYYPNGQIWYEGNYKNGKKEGEFIRYSENKNVKTRTIYRKDKREEETSYYTDTEKIFSQIIEKNENNQEIMEIRQFDINGNLIEYEILVNGYRREFTKCDTKGNVIYSKKYRKRFLQGDDPEYNLIVNEKNEELNSKKTEISEQIKYIKSELTQEQIAKKEADKKFDETRNWLGSRTERTLYKGSVFPVSRFVERIKDFNIDLKERVYRFIDSYTKDWISTITFDTGETYGLEEALKKVREIMGLPKEEK